MIMLERLRKGAVKTSKLPYSAGEVDLQKICNHTEPYLGPNEVRKMLEANQTVWTKHSSYWLTTS